MKKRKFIHEKASGLLSDLKIFWDFLGQNNLRLVSLVILVMYVVIQPGTGYYETLRLEFRPSNVRATEFDDFVPSDYPLKKTATNPPYLSAQGVVITDVNSSVVMYEQNANLRLHPASLTKLVTALVALDYYRLDDVLPVTHLGGFPEESEMGLSVGDKVTVENLLKGLLIPSGNDAAYTLADNFPGGIPNFVTEMNKKVKSLHLENTNFENPSGVDSPNHFSTPRDMSILTAVALNNPSIAKIVATAKENVRDASGKKTYRLKNVNQLLGKVPGVDGVKTGFTSQAGQCLITSTLRDGHRIVIVLMGSLDRFGESTKMVEWAFANFAWVTPEELYRSSSLPKS